jgi:hypothetical protein
MRRRIHVCNMGRKIHAISSYKVYGLGCSAQASGTGFALVQQLQRVCVNVCTRARARGKATLKILCFAQV